MTEVDVNTASSHSQPLVVRTSPTKWFIVFVAVLMVELLFAKRIYEYLAFGVAPHSRGGIGSVYFASAIGVGAMVLSLYNISRYRPVLIVGGQGLLWRKWSETIIPWPAFCDAELVQSSKGRFLMLRFIDPVAYPPKFFFSHRTDSGLLMLNSFGLDASLDEIIKAISRFAPHLSLPALPNS